MRNKVTAMDEFRGHETLFSVYYPKNWPFLKIEGWLNERGWAISGPRAPIFSDLDWTFAEKGVVHVGHFLKR